MVKMSDFLVYFMKVYGGVEVQLHSFLNLTLDVVKWPTARPGRFEDCFFMALFSGTYLRLILTWFMFLRIEGISGICTRVPLNNK